MAALLRLLEETNLQTPSAPIQSLFYIITSPVYTHVYEMYTPVLVDDHDRDTPSKSPEVLKSQTLVWKRALWERNLF